MSERFQLDDKAPRVMRVIVSAITRKNPERVVTRVHTLDGQLIAVHDPHSVRERDTESTRTSKVQRLCECGCGLRIKPGTRGQPKRFYNDKHRVLAWERKHPRLDRPSPTRGVLNED